MVDRRLDDVQCSKICDELFAAMSQRDTIPPLRERYPAMDIDDAYAISELLLRRRLDQGATLIGRKIGLTSKAVQEQLGVSEPDFGSLTDDMLYADGADVPISERLIQPKVEGEIAFVLGKDLSGPSVTIEDVIDATEYVSPCFEIVDSRIRNWDISLVDTVADNASCGLLVLGKDRVAPDSVDLTSCELTVRINSEVMATGTGAAALGSPARCVAWLANTLARYGIGLKAGDIVLSGSLVPFLPANHGDSLEVTVAGIGSASLSFS